MQRVMVWVLALVLAFGVAPALQAGGPLLCAEVVAGELPLCGTPPRAPVLVHDDYLQCPAGQISVHYPTGSRCEWLFRDAGQVCTSSDQCQGYCLANITGRGTCSATRLEAGCYDMLVGQGQVALLCVD